MVPSVNVTQVVACSTVINDHWIYLAVSLSLSIVFLCISVVIYLLLWDKKNFDRRTQFSYLLSLLLFNVVFLPALCPGLANPLSISLICFLISIANQYFFIVSKVWLLIISLDILWKSWNLEHAMQKTNWKTFLVYSILGWGFPFVITTCGVILDLRNQNMGKGVPVDAEALWEIIPAYGRCHCRKPNWMIWEIFIFSNCLIHITAFLLIILILIIHQCRLVALIPERRRSVNKYALMFLKLFIVGGLSWSYIPLQDILNAGNVNTNQGFLWQIFRTLFYLQGFLISIVYIGNAKTLKKLKQRRMMMCGKGGTTDQRVGTFSSSRTSNFNLSSHIAHK